MKAKPFINKLAGGGGTPAPAFATGADGDLIILNGQTVNVAAGAIKQYDNIDIQTGGVLNITGTSGAMTQIIAKSSFNLDGAIYCHNRVTTAGYSISGTTVSGYPYSYTSTQRIGGNGGNGGYMTLYHNTSYSRGTGGSASSGLGNGAGGGGGGINGFYGTGPISNRYAYPGNGGSANSNGQTRTLNYLRDGTYPESVTSTGGSGNLGGAGSGFSGAVARAKQNSGTLAQGGNGRGGGGGCGALEDTGLKNIGSASAAGGGGGGGARGYHSQCIFLFHHETITGTGIVYAYGGSGGAGGNGGNAANVVANAGSGRWFPGGGGGGGGAGGNGGLVIVQSGAANSLTLNTNGGSGGAGGTRGSVATSGVIGTSGSAGQTGLAGTSTIVSYP